MLLRRLGTVTITLIALDIIPDILPGSSIRIFLIVLTILIKFSGMILKKLATPIKKSRKSAGNSPNTPPILLNISIIIPNTFLK